MPQLRFASRARRDTHEIATYIRRDNPSAARRWVDSLTAKCELIAEHPEIGQSRDDLGAGIRCTLIGSYAIFYRYDNDVVEIVRVIRADRDTCSI